MKYIKRLWFSLLLPVMYVSGQIMQFFYQTNILWAAWEEIWKGEADDCRWLLWLDEDLKQ